MKIVVVLVNYIHYDSNNPDRDTLTQYSTVNALLSKVYEGEMTVNEEFYSVDLTPDIGEIVKQVERNKNDMR